MSNEKSIRQRALELYKPPFRYESLYIWDSENNIVADDVVIDAIARIRGWGRIQYMKNPEKLQDEVGEIIAEALNDFWQKHSQ